MAIAAAVQNGSFVHIYDERGRRLGTAGVSNGTLVGFTGSTVSVRNGSFIHTYDEKGRHVGTIGLSVPHTSSSGTNSRSTNTYNSNSSSRDSGLMGVLSDSGLVGVAVHLASKHSVASESDSEGPGVMAVFIVTIIICICIFVPLAYYYTPDFNKPPDLSHNAPAQAVTTSPDSSAATIQTSPATVAPTAPTDLRVFGSSSGRVYYSVLVETYPSYANCTTDAYSPRAVQIQSDLIRRYPTLQWIPACVAH
jgi:hypothetical protein